VEWGDNPASSSSKGGRKDSNSMAAYGGIVHPVESENAIDTNFCLDVVAGLMDLEPMRMRRGANRNNKHSHHHQNQQQQNAAMASGVPVVDAVKAFKTNWSTYDWTQYI
jgi:hypothetical protein